MKKVLLQSDFDNLKSELDRLENIEIPAAKLKIKEAIDSGGGFHDNAGFDHAWQDEQALLMRRDNIVDLLRNSQVVMPEEQLEIVSIGSILQLTDLETQEILIVQIAGYSVLNDASGVRRVSAVSPLGAAVLGKKQGDIVVVVGNYGEEFSYSIDQIGESDGTVHCH